MDQRYDRSSSAFMAAVMGAVLGAAAVILLDKKTRDFLKNKMTGIMEDIEETKEMGKAKINTELKKARTKLASNITP